MKSLPHVRHGVKTFAYHVWTHLYIECIVGFKEPLIDLQGPPDLLHWTLVVKFYSTMHFADF